MACCLNNLYGCYASLPTFVNFLLMKKQQKRNKIIHKIISSTISKSSKKIAKRNSPRFRTGPGQTSSWWDDFCAAQKVSEEWKENLRMSQESFENYALSWDLTSRKIKPDFEIQLQWRSKWPQHYITLQMKVGCEKSQILSVLGNRKFPKLSDVSLKLLQNTLEVNI